ncbi:MAG: hypothetical protein ABTR92_15070 [Candidatus Accumulibacter phosphatis]|uniref:hypothetical protein n=1 Tax=Candidatus Accumulibacter sp. ACC012 TaxID=2823332 RepID=UPI0025B8AEA5|nr:hypothetical protein [Candidatus Accumulibacter sp. ACC012]
MPLQNRINPEGEICTSPARGTLMGNRGCLHDDARQIVSRSKRDAWVTCLLTFKNRKRPVMSPRKYTELFFLDEATALAAGHRPCATCRRDRYDAFFAAWGVGNRNGAKVLAAEVDKQMKLDRAASQRLETASLADLPDGVIVKHKGTGTCYLLRSAKLHPWSFAGYGRAQAMSTVSGPFVILTPASTVKALQHGYRAQLHGSAT